MSSTRFGFFLLALLFATVVSAQEQNMNLLDSISARLVTQIRNSDKQQILLSKDRSVYAAGETIWFRTFLRNAYSGKLINTGKAIFIDLVNDNDSLITNVLLYSSGIQTNGRIQIPDTLTTGNYWIRAYTSEIIKDTAGFFAEPLYIINTRKSAANVPSKKIQNSSSVPLIHFAPEGGLFVTGASNIMAFKIMDPDGNPVAINGVILDNRDSVVMKFESNKNGYGMIGFYPYYFRKYRAVINWKGNNLEFPFPKFNPYGAQLSVARRSDGSRTMRVILEDSIFKKDFTTYLIGVSNDSICFASIGKGRYDVFVPDQKFPEGIATFFLFDKNFNCLSERSVYVRRDDQKINLSVNKKLFSKREKANVRIETGVPSILSVAITDSLLQDPVEEDISLLSDDELDLVMLNRGPLHAELFNERSEMRNERSEEDLLYIEGTVSNSKHEPVPQKIVTLFSGKGGLMPLTDTTDANGRFSFPLTFYLDSTQFALQVSNVKGAIEKVNVDIDPLKFPVVQTPANIKKKFEEFINSTATQFKTYSDTTSFKGKEWLATVTVQQTRKKKNNFEARRVTSFSTIIPAERFARGGAGSVTNAVLSVSGVQIINGFVVIHGLTSMNSPGPTSEPIVIVDGVQIALPEGQFASPLLEYLNTLDASQIEFIEVLKGSEGTNYGVRGSNGVISINTRRTVADYSKNPGLKVIT